VSDNTPRLDQFDDWATDADWDALQAEAAEAFLAAHPEYYACEANADLITDWCDERGIPLTLKNLEVALGELAGRLTTGQEPHAEPPRRIVTRAVRGGDAFPPALPEEAATLAKLKDDVSLSDHQRKARDEKLRRLAVAQRLTGHARPRIMS